MTTLSNDFALPADSGSVTAKAPLIEAETYGPVSAQVISITDPMAPAAEQYRLLRHRFELLAKAGYRAFAFTSAKPGEGKTTVIANAALELGRGGRNRVVLIDANLRHPCIHKALGLSPSHGLCDVVMGRADLNDCLWH